MIRVDGVARSFGGHAAVDGVSFEVAPGEVVGLLGPNGAGKTTTIRIALGVLRPSAGTVEVARPLGYLPENLQPYDGSSVRGYLRFWCRVRRLDASIDEAMADAGVLDLARRPIGRLSKGQRQRVALAQAVLGAPRALVLDEPTASLDPKQVVDVRALVRRRAEAGAAVLVSTHLLAEAAAMCDRVVVLRAGCVVAIEAPGPDLEQRFLGPHVVTRKELATLWSSPVPWVAGAALQAVLAVLFVDQLQGRAQAVVQPLFPIVGLLLVVTVPVLAMRTFAEEKRSGHLDVLLAAPVRVLPMAAAKWLAAWLTAVVVLLPALALAGLTALWGEPDPGPIVTGFVGLVLLAGAVAAVGVLTSAATSSQALAALVTILAGLVLWFVGSATSGSSTARLLGGVSLSERLRTFASGGVDRADVVFFVGIAAVGILGAAVVVRPRVGPALAAVAVLAVTSWGAGQHALTDLTEHETLTLTAITRDVVRAADDDVSITAFVGRADPGRVETVSLLDRYARLSHHLRTDVVDPDDEPGEVRRLGIDPVLGGVAVQRGDDVELATGPTEQDITSALARLLRGNDAVICLSADSGEVDISVPTYRTMRINTLSRAEIPDECTVVVVAGPQTELGEGEDVLADWVADDGKLLALLDPASDVDLEDVLSPYGLGVKRGVVFEGDPDAVVSGDESSPVVRRYSSAHPVVRNLPPTYFPGVQEVTVDDAATAPGRTVSRLADTSELSYLETKPLEPRFDPGDDSGGPITIAAAVDESRVVSDAATARTRIVVVGDVDFATADFAGAAANARFLSQAIGWLALDDDLIPLSSNLPEDRPLELTDARVAYARFLGVVAIPGLLLLGGGIVWAARRRR